MLRLSLLLSSATLLTVGCSDPAGRDVNDGPLGSTSGDVSPVPTSGTPTTQGDSDPTADDDTGPPPPDDDGPGDDTSTGEEPVDCTPAWATPWIGSPCLSDTDCSYEGGQCLQDSDGFPCGTCTLPCTMLCRDLEQTPVTYCINGTDVGQADTGYCLSKCDPTLVPGNGCRDGYVCNVLERFDGSGVDDVCIPEEFDDTQGGMYVDEIDHEFLIEHFGGTVVDAFSFGPDVDSLQLYLDAVGVQHTTALEFVEPYNQAAATGCGLDLLLPDRDQWEKIGALGMFTDVLTELVGEPIFVRNWWRPPCYNEAVGGAPSGDHPDADAVDLDFMSPASRAMAQQFLCENYWAQDIVPPEQIAPGSDLDPRLNMSIGLGGVTIHLGVLSAGGRRFWTYDSYTVEPDSGNCW